LVKPILDELEVAGFSLKNIVNAGVLLFSKLSGDEQKTAIAAANGEQIALADMTDEIFRQKVLRILKDAQAIVPEKSAAREAKRSKSG